MRLAVVVLVGLVFFLDFDFKAHCLICWLHNLPGYNLILGIKRFEACSFISKLTKANRVKNCLRIVVVFVSQKTLDIICVLRDRVATVKAIHRACLPSRLRRM